MNIALLTAAGNGTRMHQDIPKQFIHVDNKPILIHTLERFQEHPAIDAIIVVTLENWIDMVWAYAKQFGIEKLRWVVPGGSSGQESIYRGIEELRRSCHDEDVVVIHDGNRCNVSAEVVTSALAVYKECGDAVAAIPCVEVVFVSDEWSPSLTTIPREKLLRTQTPHVFDLKTLTWAHEEAAKLGLHETAATCSLMQALGKEVHFSKGSEENIKITTTDDLRIFQALIHTDRESWLK